MSTGATPPTPETRPPTPTWVKALAVVGLVLLLAVAVTRFVGVPHGPGMHDAPSATHGPGMHDTPQPTIAAVL